MIGRLIFGRRRVVTATGLDAFPGDTFPGFDWIGIIHDSILATARDRMSANIDSDPTIRSFFQLSAIPVQGSQAGEFLQSQLTLDLDQLEDPLVLQPAAWCKPDGRAEIVLLVARHGDGFVLVLPRALLQQTQKKLRLFSIGRDVHFAEALAVAEQADNRDENREHAPEFALAHDRDRRLYLSPAGHEDLTPALSQTWLAADARAGMPWLWPATSGLFLPQMLGLETLQGLSYRKGCYPGQEVIARVHYRGRLTRHICRFESEGPRIAEPGLEFDLDPGKGTVLYAAPDPSRHPRITGLAVVPADQQLPCPIVLDNTAATAFSD